MSGYFVIDSKKVPAPGLVVTNYVDDKRLRLRVGQLGGGNDGARRKTRWIRSIVIHTTKGIPGGDDQRPQTIIPGSGPNLGKEFDVAKFWATSTKSAGAAFVVDTDGSVGQLHDLVTEAAYHTGNPVNDLSIGIEMYQGQKQAEIYQATIDATVVLCHFLTAYFGIQRQIPDKYRGPIDRLDEGGGADCVGVFGHRDITDRRGAGDPGDAVMNALASAGYERFDFNKGEDIATWKVRQRSLSDFSDMIDGVPGPVTVAALKRAGYENGLWSYDNARSEFTAVAKFNQLLAESLIPLIGEERAREFLRKLGGG